MREIIKLVLVLSLICAASASALQVVRNKLSSRIEQQNDLFVRGPALESLFNKPADMLLSNKMLFKKEGQKLPVFYNMDGSRITGIALEAIGKGGYGGDISVMIGVDLEKEKLIGIEIIQHSETPGVGSRIENPGFRAQWRNLPVNKTVSLKKNGGMIDAVSGATYSSAAVVHGTNIVIDLLKQNQSEILKQVENQIQLAK